MLRRHNSARPGVRARLNYANVMATLAVILALGGTATAAITLPNNSVGSPQIQADAVGASEIATDAVRAAEIRANAVGSDEIDSAAVGAPEIAANAVGGPEIEANAVGSPEIEANAVRGPEIEANAVGGPEIDANAVGGPEIATDAVGGPEIETDAVGSPEIEESAVRSSEILDDTIRLADIAPDAQAALDEPRVRVDTDIVQDVLACDAIPDCPNLASIQLPEGRWLVQTRFTINGEFSDDDSDFCALVQSDTSLVDFAFNVGAGTTDFGSEQVSLMAVLTTTPGDALTTVAVRCDESSDGFLKVPRIVLTGIEVAP